MIDIPKIFKRDDADGNPLRLTLPLLPLRDIVVFPHMVSPLFVGRSKSINAISEAIHSRDKFILLATQSDPGKETPRENEINRIGTVAKVLQVLRLPDSTVKTVVEGKQRARILEFRPNESFFEVTLEMIEEPELNQSEKEAFFRNIVSLLNEYGELNKNFSKDTIKNIAAITDPVTMIYIVAGHFSFKTDDNQFLLETDAVSDRLTRLIELIKQEIIILETDKVIKTRIKEQMDKSQKNYYLNEQIRAIKKEMGSDDAEIDELQELEKRIQDAKMPEEADTKARHELKKLKMMTPLSAEATVVRNYIDWLISLPWSKKTKIAKDIEKARKILDEDHYGLKKPKERILEYLAVQTLVKKIRGPILCLVGPPGVGKTSLAKSVARATGRKFVRLSLGGVRDEAEIRGHRRTYIGAMPGKIIQSIKKVGVTNPVFCLDEIDKMSMDFRGDPSAALLEVLDPEQNYSFNDHYLDVEYDLSDIMFITTANTLPEIPLPLQDRMEIIRLSGYTEIEKYHIARNFLVPKQIKQNGLKKSKVLFSQNAIYTIIRDYTREAGVRNLEREIASVCRKVAKELVKTRKGVNGKAIAISSKTVIKYLGPGRNHFSLVEKENQVGIVTGLAWTQFGGELLCVETVTMPGKGEFTVSGKLGDVMKESAKAAISYVRSRSEQFNMDQHFYEKLDIHIHVPEGAIPKDGPSAGIAMCTAIISALTRLPVDRNVAMTGEITLRGRVLPIGGLKEKVLAAHRGGIKKILIPKANERDISDIPASVAKQLEIIPVEHMDEVVKHAIIEIDGKPLYNLTQNFDPDHLHDSHIVVTDA
ncbi:MAG: endopeptidase La [Desulfobacterales bacterium CG23_combo_of_CG06-09_8_20_14_all_51_8]|nr:MAG: endopeptidase La [Desulfobacterales bacterium CG23_combo_of_CG06-09_8_20_14_all_51_8]